MKQRQRQKETGKEIQRETFKNLQQTLFNTVVVDFNLDEFEEVEIEDEIPSETEDELEYAPEFEDFDDDEVVEYEEIPSEPTDVAPLRGRKYVVELFWIDDEPKLIAQSNIGQSFKVEDSIIAKALRTATLLRLEAAKFIVERQRGYIEGTTPLRRLTQRELQSHLNRFIEELDSKQYIKIKLKESQIERFLDSLYLKIPKRGVHQAKSFFSGKRSSLSKEEWKTFVHEFINSKGIPEIKTATLELAKEFYEFLTKRGVEVELKAKSKNPHDQYRTLKNKLREYGKAKE